MFEVVAIGDGDMDRFIEVKNDDGMLIKVFDYSASTVLNQDDSFQVEKGQKYNMKLELYGDLIDEHENKNVGRNIAFKILHNDIIGQVEFYLISCELGEVYIRDEQRIKEMINNDVHEGFYNFTRIDLIQLDDKVHPELI